MGVRSALDVVASVAMIAASCAILLGVFGVGRERPDESRADKAYALGEVFPEIAGLPAGSVTVLWLHSRCRYCQESMPFYRRLTSRVGGTAVIAMGPEPASTLRAYLEMHGLAGIRALTVQPASVAFSATPALAVLDADRRVRGVWIGKLRDSSAEDDVVAMASRLLVRTGFFRGKSEVGPSHFAVNVDFQ
jgi:hypothetical protein